MTANNKAPNASKDSRKEMQEKLKEISDLMKETERTAKIGGWKFNPLTLKQTWSDEVFRILEVDMENGAPEVPEGIDFIDPEFRSEAEKAIQRSIQYGEPYDQEWIITTNKGNKKWVRAVCKPLMKKGKLISVSGSFQDITDRKVIEEQLLALNQQLQANEQQLMAANQQLQASEQQLRAANQQLQASEQQLRASNESLLLSEKQFRQLFENMEQGFAFHKMIYNKNGTPVDYRFLLINHAFEKLTGNKASEIIGRTVKEAIPGLEQEWIDNYGKVAKTGKALQFEHYSSDLNRYYNVVAYSPKKDFFATVFTDNTSIRLRDKTLTELNAQLVMAQNIGKLGYWTLDIKTQLPKWSDEIFTMFGIPPEEGEPDYSNHKKYIHPDDWDHFDNSIQVLIKEDTPYDIQIRIINTSRKTIWIRSQGFAKKDISGEITELYGIVQDISDFKSVEDELILAKEKAEESDRLKSSFLANMSHEIRTPMNGILGFTDMLQDPEVTGEDQQKFIEIIKKSGDRMLTTINDLIDISKIETGQVELSLKEFNISDELNSQFHFFQAETEKKGINFTLTNTLPDNSDCITADLQKFNSILTNLIKNAIKFTDKGYINLGCIRKDDRIECFVKDSGIGIPENRQKAIFERFVQADINDKHAFEGSGLGLAISKAYAEIMGGELWVESEEGIGSTFYLSIPYQDSEAKNTDSPVKESIKQISLSDFKPKILIAEDDEVSFQHLSIILEDFSREIIHAKMGIEAVELCRTNKDIDLVLMDIKMPRLNGYEATQRIREFNKDIVIIAQTAYAFEGDRIRSIESGCNDYIVKPIAKDKLIKTISKWLDK